MYTINCRAKGQRRTILKCERLADEGNDISYVNFYRKVPDLVGARLVVVDPNDMFRLAEKVRLGCVDPTFCTPDEPLSCARVRFGRFSMYDLRAFENTSAYKLEEESTGYCSVHFVYRLGRSFFPNSCNQEQLAPFRSLDEDRIIPMEGWHVEIQVRTIMDEAWGETDHFVRYEDEALRDDPEIRDQLTGLGAYLQAASHHVALIREAARRKKRKGLT
jgi:ppGpp synthetase/RelA/SpoT-type nucleotidyltranferase